MMIRLAPLFAAAAASTQLPVKTIVSQGNAHVVWDAERLLSWSEAQPKP